MQTDVPDLRPRRMVPWKWIAVVLVTVIAVAIGVHEWRLIHSNTLTSRPDRG